MLKLTERPPEGISVLGYFYRLNTDFRYWIDYPDRLRRVNKQDFEGYAELFAEDIPVPNEAVIEALNGFYYIPNEIPRNSSGETLLSYKYDADYIYAAFLQAYGIDIVEEPLHWHKFLALLGALPESTMMVKIIGYRSYDGNSKDNPSHSHYLELKQSWQLPLELTEEERAQIDRFNSL